MIPMTSYTDEQVLECAATYEGYGEPVCPAILRALLADRTRLRAQCEEWEIKFLTQEALIQDLRGELKELQFIDCARAKKGDL